MKHPSHPILFFAPLAICMLAFTACQPTSATRTEDTFATALVADVLFYDILTQTQQAHQQATTIAQSVSAVLAQTQTAQPTIQSAATPIPPTLTPSPIPYIPPTDFNVANTGTVAKNLTYCAWDGEAVRMNLHYPAQLNKRWPVVVVIHGGSWQTGGKGYGVANHFVAPLVQAGYLVADIDYRLAPEHIFPAQINDVKCAIRHLRAHADTYNLNPDAIALLGFSAGGHLAALAGAADKTAGFDTGQYAAQSSRAQVIVDISGVINLQYFCNLNTVQTVFAAQDCQDSQTLYPANPAAYLTPDDPPVLIFHGDADTAVPMGFSTYYQEKLDTQSIFNMLYVVESAGHAYGLNTADTPTPPYLKDMESIMLLFLDLFLPPNE